MAISIERFDEAWVPAVKAFNARLRAGGEQEFDFPEVPPPAELPQQRIFQRLHLACEGEHVRGGFILRWQDFWINNQVQSIAHYRLPLSEGIVDKRYARVATHLLRSALKTEPLLFCLGMGGLGRPLPQMLKALRWVLHEVPFYFHVLRGNTFLREVQPLRASPSRRRTMDLAAQCGLGHLALAALHVGQRWKRHTPGKPGRPVEVEAFAEFGPWADDLWRRARKHYAVCSVRNSDTLNQLYPPDDRRFVRIRLMRDGYPVGWIVLLDTQMSEHKQFGNMRVGTLVDGMAEPGELDKLVAVAIQTLKLRGAHLAISNQAHVDWRQSLERCGFIGGPSNYIFACSPQLAKLMEPLVGSLERLHMTRGDGDGPIHL